MNVEFKEACAKNLDALLSQMRALYDEDGFAKFDERMAREGLEKLSGDERFGRAFLIIEDDEAIGYFVVTFGFSLEFRGRFALIDEFYIVPARRGRGVGATAIKFMETFCRAHGIAAVRLEVERENIRAQKLHRNFGFKEHERYLMTKWLDE